MSDLVDIRKTIDQMNQQITGVNSTLASYAQEVRKNPVLLQKQTAKLKDKLQKVFKQPEKIVEKKSEVKTEIKEDKRENNDYSVTGMWGDPRYNPYFLKVAEYFGIDQREYPYASSKINVIVDWAANKTKSKNISNILKKIEKTSFSLPGPDFKQRRYDILYRHIKYNQE